MFLYKILIEGGNCLVDDTKKKYGFFCTRYIKAKDMDEAMVLVVKSINEELNEVIINSNITPTIKADEIEEVDSSFFEDLKGFTWFLEEE